MKCVTDLMVMSQHDLWVFIWLNNGEIKRSRTNYIRNWHNMGCPFKDSSRCCLLVQFVSKLPYSRPKRKSTSKFEETFWNELKQTQTLIGKCFGTTLAHTFVMFKFL